MTRLTRLLEAITGPGDGPARPSWQTADEAHARDVLARLEHHARTFPNPSVVDDAVVRRAALDLRRRTR